MGDSSRDKAAGTWPGPLTFPALHQCLLDTPRGKAETAPNNSSANPQKESRVTQAVPPALHRSYLQESTFGDFPHLF